MDKHAVRLAAVGAAAFAVVVAGAVAAGPAGARARSVTVSGALKLDPLGNRLSITAHSARGGSATGRAVLIDGLRSAYNASAPRIIRVRITCLRVLGPSTVAVGGRTVGASAGVGTVWPYYTFVLEDRGPGLRDKWTMWSQYRPFRGASPCTDARAPAVETSAGGNIVIRGL